MAKTYWISSYRAVTNPDKLTAYAKLAGPAIAAGGGKFLVRGTPAKTYEAGLNQRIRVVRLGADSADVQVMTGEPGQIIADMASDEAFEGYWHRPDADARALRGGWYFTGSIKRCSREKARLVDFFSPDADLNRIGLALCILRPQRAVGNCLSR